MKYSLNNAFTGCLSLIFTTSLFVGCDSRVTTLNNAVESSSQVEQKAILEPSISILSNSTQGTQKTCTQNNSVKFLVVQSKSKKIMCRDRSILGSSYKIGPVCPGGVEVRTITTTPNVVPCEDMMICGKTYSDRKTLSSQDSTQNVYEMTFDNLPWGCEVKVEYDMEEKFASGDPTTEFKIMKGISVSPAECNLCKSSAYTCEACAEDKTPPIIQDIVFEKPKCGQLVVRVVAADVGLGLADQPFSFDGGKTWQETDFKVYNSISKIDFTVNQIWVKDRSGNITKSAKALSGQADPCGCYTAWGSLVPHLGTQPVYKMQEVECMKSCDTQKQVQTCNNGVWSGTNDYKYQTCKVKDCPCTAPWGAQIPHGYVGKAYKISTTTCKDDCQFSNFSCDQGVIKGLISAEYKYESCKYTVEKCNCEYKGITILNNKSSSYFAAKSVKCNETCKLGKVSCKDGVLSGDTTYTETSCSPEICKCVTPWGELLSQGEERNVYVNSSLSCDNVVNCGDATNISRIKCTDAPKNSITNVTNPGVPITTYKASSCTKAVCACSHLGIVFKPTDAPIPVYKTNEAVFPSKCELATNMGTVTCSKEFKVTGDTNTTTFPYTECKNLTTGKDTGTGMSETDVGAGDGGGKGGGVGNDEGDGEGFRRRSKGGGKGSGCDINVAPYFCATTNVYQINYGNFCLLPIESGYDVSLISAVDYRQRISPGGWIALYSKKEVGCGEKCSDHLGLSQCVLGRMSEKTKFKYMDCVEKCK